mgnify:CR=1 FL=1
MYCWLYLMAMLHMYFPKLWGEQSEFNCTIIWLATVHNKTLQQSIESGSRLHRRGPDTNWGVSKLNFFKLSNSYFYERSCDFYKSSLSKIFCNFVDKIKPIIKRTPEKEKVQRSASGLKKDKIKPKFWKEKRIL